MTGLPLLLDLRGRRVVVVGGGAVAERRARALVEAEAEVVVVAPQVRAGLAALGVSVTPRPFADADLDGAWLVIACTDSTDVNAAVAQAAEDRQIFCVRADSAPGGTARTSAVVRTDDLTIAINGGDDPGRSVALRAAIAAALDAGDLPTRRHRGRTADAVGTADVGRGVGSVMLVGGGPGDPELITVRGRRLVADADVVVVDRLAPRELLDTLPADVEVIDCGKSAHRHTMTQDEINAVLVDRALAGKRVVRLKGGDPFVFGRGGEEWLACVAAGVPVTVVPGISAALAAPALAGIPLTHRGMATEFTVVSGHEDPADADGAGLDWAALAAGGGTLVLLMAMGRLAAIADELIAHGRPAATPAAVVHSAATPRQRVVRSSLGHLADAAAGLGAPAVVVVGEVVDVLDRPDAGD